MPRLITGRLCTDLPWYARSLSNRGFQDKHTDQGSAVGCAQQNSVGHTRCCTHTHPAPSPPPPSFPSASPCLCPVFPEFCPCFPSLTPRFAHPPCVT